MSMKDDFKTKSALRCLNAGGPVTGPGGPTQDKVPAMLSDGEYVMPADSVQIIGKDKLDMVRRATSRTAAEHEANGATGPRRINPLRKLAAGGYVNADFIKDRVPGVPQAPDPVDPIEKLKIQQRMNARLDAARPLQGAAAEPVAAAAQPAAAEAAGARGLFTRGLGVAGRMAGAPTRFAGRVAGGLARGAGAVEAASGSLETLGNAMQGSQLPDYANPLRRLQQSVPGAAGGMAFQDKHPMLRELNELPNTAINVVADAGKNTINSIAGLAGYHPFGDAQAAASTPLATGPGAPKRVGSALRAPASGGQQFTNANGQPRTTPDGIAVVPYTTPDGVRTNAFGGKGTPKASPLRDYTQDAARLQDQYINGTGGGGGPTGNAGAINKQFDRTEADINALHDGARFHANGARADKLLRLAEARAGALGNDYSTTQGGYNSLSGDATARRGQDMALDQAGINNAGENSRSALRAQIDMQKYGQEQSGKAYDRFKDLAKGLFTKTDPKTGQPVEDPAMTAQFLSEAMQNVKPEAFAAGPEQFGPMVLDAHRRFLQNQETNKANGTTSSVWDSNLQETPNVSAYDAFTSKGVGAGDVAMDSLDGLPLVDQRSLLTDSQGRKTVRVGTDNLDLQRQIEADAAARKKRLR